MHPRSSSLLFLFLLVGIAAAQTTIPSTAQPAQSSLNAITGFNQNVAQPSAFEHPLQAQVLKQEWMRLKDELIELKAQQRHSEAADVFERMSRLERDLGWRKDSDTRDPNSLDQGGETCADAFVISSLPFCAYGNTTGFDNDYAGSCIYSSAPDVVYQFTPAGTVTVTISLCGSGYDTGLHVWRGCPSSGGVEVACNDDAVGGICGTNSCVTVQLHGENSYYIMVDGYSSNYGSYLINITTDGTCHSEGCGPCPYPRNPVADNCADAIPLDSNPVQWGSTVGQTSEYGLPTCNIAVDSSPGVWYKVTGDGRTFTISLCDGCTNFDTKLHVYYGACGFLTCVTSSDDTPTCSQSTLFSEVTWCSEYAVDYFVLVSGSGNAAGDFTITFSVGDACSQCEHYFSFGPNLPVTQNTCTFNTNQCNFRPSLDMIAQLYVPYDGTYTIDLCQTGTPWDTYIYLTTQCCGGTVIAADDEGCGNGLSKIECVYLTAGFYYLTVEGYSSLDCGEFSLIFYMCGAAACCYGPPNDPVCVFVSESACDVLGGDWLEGDTCTQGLCYSAGICPPRSEFSQPPAKPDASIYLGHFSDEAVDQLMFEYIPSMTSSLVELRFWGFVAERAYQTPCVQDPLPVRISFHFDSLGHPGPFIQSMDTALAGSPGYIYHLPNGDFTRMEYTTWINPPMLYDNVWISIFTPATSTCQFMWATSEVGDYLSAQWLDGELMLFPIDLSLCLVPCLIDEERTAPFSYAGNTCGAMKDCPLSTGEDISIEVDFPYWSWWDISLCGSPPWDSKMRYSGWCCDPTYVEDDNGCGDGQHAFMTHYFPSNYDIIITVNGATEFDCGEFTLLVTEALGRCCYYGPGEPWCGNMTYESCMAQSGNRVFTPYLDCAIDPCPPPPECLPGSAVSQPPVYWGLNEEASDIQTGYRAYEHFHGLTAPVDSIRFWGFLSSREEGLGSSCTVQTPQSFLISFHADSMDWPGAVTDSYSMWLTGTPVFQINVNPDKFVYEFTTAIPSTMVSSGWISIATNGFDPEDDCVLEWLTSPSGDNFHVFATPGSGLSAQPSDLAFCLKTEFTGAPADSLTAYYNPVEQMIELRWYAPQRGWWTVYKSTDVNAVFPDSYTYIATSIFGPGPGIAFDPDLSSEQARYIVVMHDSHPSP